MSIRQRLGLSQDSLYLMDGSAFVFRGFYAFQNMSRSDGLPTNALYVVLRLLLRILREERPSHFAFILDGKGPNFRHRLYEPYKAQRLATPEPLIRQIEPLCRAVEQLGLRVEVSKDCEADDCIASLAERNRSERDVVIIGADKDLKQCLHPRVSIWDPALKDEKLTTYQSFTEETGLAPDSWPDYQALIGDSSDNIPGVPGIGPKGAMALMRDFPKLEDMAARFAAVPPAARKKLDGHMDEAFLYRRLTTLSCGLCQDLSLEDLRVRPVNLGALMDVLGEFELRSLAREAESMQRAGFFQSAASLPDNPAPVAGKAQSVKKDRAAAQPLMPLLDAAPAGEILKSATREEVTPLRPSGAVQMNLLGSGDSESDASDALDGLERLEDLSGFADSPELMLLLPLAALAGRNAGPDRAPGFILAQAGREGLYSGEPANLLDCLKKRPGRAAVPDLKALAAANPVWLGLNPERCLDCSLAAYLLSPEDRDYSWSRLLRRWAEAACALDGGPGLKGLALAGFLAGQVESAGLAPVLYTLEQPLAHVLLDMEKQGLGIDRDAFAGFLNEVQAQLEDLSRKIQSFAGGPFNIRSAQQLGAVLFDVLKLPKAGKTKGGQASTSQEALEKLTGKHPIIEAILEFRKLEKLRSTYLEPLPRLAGAEGRIHTTFNQSSTATGRLSSSNPNLQNIPVRGPEGRRMRSCFVSGPGNLLVSADYSQVELRVLAHLSQDPTLLDAFARGEDIHSRTAGLLFDAPASEVTPDQRRSAKTINFGLVYGMGPQSLAQDLRISLNEAKAFIARYFERLGKLKIYYESVEASAKEHGFVATMSGRRRLVPEISSANDQLRSQARRQAINTCIQGSAADIIKLAMLAVAGDDRLKRLGARLILQIHDELLLEAPEDNAKEAGALVAELMAGVRPGGVKLDAPLAVDWGVGRSWDDAH